MITNKFILFFIVFISLFLTNSIVCAKMYKYNDDKGVTRYQDYPPENIDPGIEVEELPTFKNNSKNNRSSKNRNGNIKQENYKRELFFYNRRYTFKGKSRGTNKQNIDLTVSKDGLKWLSTYNGHKREHYVIWEAVEYWYLSLGGLSFTYFISKALKLNNPKALTAFHFDLPYGDEQTKLAQIFMEIIPDHQKSK